MSCDIGIAFPEYNSKKTKVAIWLKFPENVLYNKNKYSSVTWQLFAQINNVLRTTNFCQLLSFIFQQVSLRRENGQGLIY